jgi:hypothetical protein
VNGSAALFFTSIVSLASSPMLWSPSHRSLWALYLLLIMRIGKDEIFKSVGSLILGLIFFFAIFFFTIRWCARGYNKFVIYVQVEKEDIFKNTLNTSDPHLLNYGRKLKEEVIAIDNDKDNGDGPNFGKVRWYVCGGIDCDEGWDSRFISER